MRAAVLIPLTLFCAIASADAPKARTVSPKVQIGSISPSIKVDSWVQGRSTNIIRAGQIYVLEFWATWCGPCVKAMPHVSELSKKYQDKIEFIGVNVWEDQGGGDFTAPAKVKQFMKDNPGLMSYSVAIDTKDGYMASNWLEAAGVDSIPKTVVIGRDQKVAFIGHPLELDLVLPDIVAGKFDAKAFEKRPKTPDLKGIDKAIAKKDSKTLRIEADRIGKEYPQYKDLIVGFRFVADYIDNPSGSPEKFEILLQSKEYYSLTLSLGFLGAAPWTDKADWIKIASFLEKIVETKDPSSLMAFAMLSHYYDRLGDAAKAAETRKRFTEYAREVGLDEELIQNLLRPVSKSPAVKD